MNLFVNEKLMQWRKEHKKQNKRESSLLLLSRKIYSMPYRKSHLTYGKTQLSYLINLI